MVRDYPYLTQSGGVHPDPDGVAHGESDVRRNSPGGGHERADVSAVCPTDDGAVAVDRLVDALLGVTARTDLTAAPRRTEQRGSGGPVGHEYDPRRADGGGDPS